MRQGKLEQKSIVDAEKLCYLFLPSINVRTLRINDADLDPYLSDDEIQYIFLDEPIQTKVLVV